MSVINVPNSVTFLRLLLLAPLFLVLNRPVTAIFLFMVIALLDAVDGYLARKLNQATEFGQYFDFLSDTIIVVSILAYYMSTGSMAALNAGLFIIGFCFLLAIAIVLGVKTKKAYMPHFTSSKILFIFLNLSVGAYIIWPAIADLVFFFSLAVAFVYTIPDYLLHIRNI